MTRAQHIAYVMTLGFKLDPTDTESDPEGIATYRHSDPEKGKELKRYFVAQGFSNTLDPRTYRYSSGSHFNLDDAAGNAVQIGKTWFGTYVSFLRNVS